MAKNKIVMFTAKDCDYCKRVKEAFNKEKVKFTEKDTEKDNEEWGKVVGLVGLAISPTLVVNDEYFYVPGRDYNEPDPLVDFLKNTKVEFRSEFSTDVLVLQSLKTLNYNVNRMLMKISQDLDMLKQTRQ